VGCGAIHATLGLRRVCDREPRRRLSVWRKMIRDGGGEEGRRGRHLTNLNLFCQLPPTPSCNREIQRGLRERVPPWQATQGGMRKESVVFGGEEENPLAVWSEKHVERKGGGRVSAELTALTISPIRCTSAMAGHHSVSHSNSHPNSPRPDLARNPRDFKFRGPFWALTCLFQPSPPRLSEMRPRSGTSQGGWLLFARQALSPLALLTSRHTQLF